MIESRTDVLVEYTVNERGVIVDLGKFENEPLYAPYFYTAFIDGCGEDIGSDAALVAIEELDRNQFPELGTAKYVLVSESNEGFVSTQLIETEAEAEELRDEDDETKYNDEDED